MQEIPFGFPRIWPFAIASESGLNFFPYRNKIFAGEPTKLIGVNAPMESMDFIPSILALSADRRWVGVLIHSPVLLLR